MPDISTSSQPRRHWLITSPRSASNMFIKILNLEEQNVLPAHHGGHFFLNTGFARLEVMNKHVDEWTGKQMKAILEGQQKAYDSLQEYVDLSEAENKKVFVREHAISVAEPMYENGLNFPGSAEPSTMIIARKLPRQTRSDHNKTVLPDEFLTTWTPTFLIRHPAMAFPSFIRALTKAEQRKSDEGLYPGVMTLSWQRRLYDFFAQHFESHPAMGEIDGVKWPIVLDADDVIAYPDIVAKYAKLVGLDPEKLRFEWEAEDPEKVNTMEKIFHSTIIASRGIRKDKLAGDLDISKEAIKWKSEFGDKVGEELEKCVREAMPDYEFMRSGRLRPE